MTGFSQVNSALSFLAVGLGLPVSICTVGEIFHKNPMPGYSGTPLPKKLGLKPGFYVYLANAPPEVRSELHDVLAKCEARKNSDTIDFAMLFTKSQLELSKRFAQLAKRLAPAGMLWVGWPKKSSGVATDLTENEVRAVGLGAGLVDVKVCAVTEIWSGLKFVRRLKDRKATDH